MSRPLFRDYTSSWLSGLIARLIVVVFVAPFLVLLGAVVFAMTASQVGEPLATIVAPAFVVGAVYLLLRWMHVCHCGHDQPPDR